MQKVPSEPRSKGEINGLVAGAMKLQSIYALTRLALDDRSILLRCLFALAYGGEPLEEKTIWDACPKQLGISWQKMIKTVDAATSMIRHLKRPTHGVLKAVISKQLAIKNVTSNFHEPLHAFGATLSKTTEDQATKNKMNETLKQGYEFEKHLKYDYAQVNDTDGQTVHNSYRMHKITTYTLTRNLPGSKSSKIQKYYASVGVHVFCVRLLWRRTSKKSGSL